jgi:EAL domain-containing protein (putative c-di-GMP-specific phosphodiesterase class I)
VSPARATDCAGQVLTFPRTIDPAPPAPESEELSPALAGLAEALREERLELHYQPQVDATARVVSHEALVRYRDEAGRLVFPDAFIAQAENSELIVALGRSVLATACADLARSRTGGAPGQRVAVNVSPGQLARDRDFADFALDTIARHGLVPEDVEFELTERQQLDRAGAARRGLARLAEHGCRLALDDFGTGYASVARLLSLPVRTVKLDRELISPLPDGDRARRIVDHVLALARDLGLEVVAEGVESEQQARWLQEAGCDLFQGFLYGRPAPARLGVGTAAVA